MSISVEDIDAELKRREASTVPDTGVSSPSVEDIDAELVRRGATRPESMMGQVGNYIENKAVDFATSVATPQGVGRKISEYLPAIGAVVGGAIAPGVGVPMGAGLGAIAKRGIGIATGAEPPAGTPWQEAKGPMLQAAAGGIPETTEGQAAIGKVGNWMAKAGHTMSGVKPDILKQVAKQGLSTYAAPSLSKASEAFGEALGAEGQAALKTTAEQDFDPVLGQMRSIAKDIGGKLESGETVLATDALKARQATDRIISATPVTDKKTLGALYGWRDAFDKVMTSQSGELKAASDLYRKAVVKDTILNPTRLTKSGQPSAFLPLVLGAGARSAEGIGNTLLGTSPAAWGLGAAVSGSIPPEARQAALAAFIDKFTTKDNAR